MEKWTGEIGKHFGGFENELLYGGNGLGEWNSKVGTMNVTHNEICSAILVTLGLGSFDHFWIYMYYLIYYGPLSKSFNFSKKFWKNIGKVDHNRKNGSFFQFIFLNSISDVLSIIIVMVQNFKYAKCIRLLKYAFRSLFLPVKSLYRDEWVAHSFRSNSRWWKENYHIALSVFTAKSFNNKVEIRKFIKLN